MVYLPVSLVINNVKMAQDRIEDHKRCRCLVGTVMAGSIAINPFSYRPTKSLLEAFRFGFLHNAESFAGHSLGEGIVNDKLEATSHARSVL